MSNRKTLVDALRRLTSATLPELVDATGWPERKVRDTLGDLKTAGLAAFERDDVTGKPLYRLTHAGAAWQTPAAGRPKTSVTQAGSGANNPGSPRPHLLPCDSVGGAGAVAEPPTPEKPPAEARSDETSAAPATPFDADDDSDPAAFPRQRIICTASSDGQTTIHRFGSTSIVLTASETRKVYEFFADSARIWGAVL